MSDTINLVSGDQRPSVVLTLTNSTDGTPVDLSGATTSVAVAVRPISGGSVVETLACSKVGDGSGGQVTFRNIPATLAAGNYEGEIQVTFGSERQTVYEALKFRVRAKFS